MKAAHRQPWLSDSRIDGMVQLEPALVLIGFALAMWALYLVLLRNTTRERHRSLRSELSNLTIHAGIFGGLTLAYFSLDLQWFEQFEIGRLRSWLGLLVLVQGAVLFIKSLKSLVTQALFLGHMREGVPALLINTFTATASLVVGGWLAAAVFDFRLAPLLATSAVASVVLGLAVQDSLGNLFAGIAMQLDKPYEIGDWIEVVSLAGRWSGQVQEVTWRATVLTGLDDELIVIPNRAVGQAQVLNFTQRSVPVARHLDLLVPPAGDVDATKQSLQAAIAAAAGVATQPPPEVLIRELTPEGVQLRCHYWVISVAFQHRTADAVATAALHVLRSAALVGG